MTLLAVLVAAFVIVTVSNMRLISHRIDQVMPLDVHIAHYEAKYRAGRGLPLDERDVELWSRQINDPDSDDAIIREASR